MKIRIGFVSNSSSSSFITTTKEFKTTKDVALWILKDIIKLGDNDSYQKYIDTLNQRDTSIDPNMMIEFRYMDGYRIAKIANEYYIEGTQHHELYNHDEFQYVNHNFDNVDISIPETGDVYLVEYDLVVKLHERWNRCKLHYWTDLYIIDGVLQCPQCYLELRNGAK